MSRLHLLYHPLIFVLALSNAVVGNEEPLFIALDAFCSKARAQQAFLLHRYNGEGSAPDTIDGVLENGTQIKIIVWVAKLDGRHYLISKTLVAGEQPADSDIREVFSWNGAEARRVTYNSPTSNVPLVTIESQAHKRELLNRTIAELICLRTPFGEHGVGFSDLFKSANTIWRDRHEQTAQYSTGWEAEKYLHRIDVFLHLNTDVLDKIRVGVYSKEWTPVSVRDYIVSPENDVVLITTTRYGSEPYEAVKWEADLITPCDYTVTLADDFRAVIPPGSRVRDERFELNYRVGENLVQVDGYETNVAHSLAGNTDLPAVLYDTAEHGPLINVRTARASAASTIVVLLLMIAAIGVMIAILWRSRARAGKTTTVVLLSAYLGCMCNGCNQTSSETQNGLYTKNLGEVAIDEGPQLIEVSWDLPNTLETEMRIDRVIASCGCLAVTTSESAIQPGESATVLMRAEVSEIGPKTVRATAIDELGVVRGRFDLSWRGVYRGELRVIATSPKGWEVDDHGEISCWLYYISTELEDIVNLVPTIRQSNLATFASVGSWRVLDAGNVSIQRPIRLLAPARIQLSSDMLDQGNTTELYIELTNKCNTTIHVET